ncbi:MAG: ATP-grasp domain-containing protein [Candidatus Omnitrophota bacterium]
MAKQNNRVLVVGIGGASLGTELLKCLRLTGGYRTYGCDISELAYGHYAKGFEKTFIIDASDYVNSVCFLCKKENISFIIPGGEEPMVILNEARSKFLDEGIFLISNSSDVFETFSDKKRAFRKLETIGIKVPLTWYLEKLSDLEAVSYPIVIKPAQGSGGSNFVFLASNYIEAKMYVNYMFENNRTAIAQEYLPEHEEEYTVGVLSVPGGKILSSIALRRIFNAKLTISSRTKTGIISSGNSQGLIDDFPEVCEQSEIIARAVGSEGPLNIQGRIKDGVFVPFEINPRFSASIYLRALAGVNEVDMFLKYILTGELSGPSKIKKGYYLRGFSEVFIEKERVKKW